MVNVLLLVRVGRFLSLLLLVTMESAGKRKFFRLRVAFEFGRRMRKTVSGRRSFMYSTVLGVLSVGPGKF